MNRNLWKSPWAPVGVHVVLCLVHLGFLMGSPLLRYLTIDLESYDLWAREIAGGQWIGTRIFYQDPLYPYLMALIYKLTGADIVHVLAVQVVASAGTVWLVRKLAGALYSDRVALWAGWMAALYLPAVYYAGKPEKACFSAFGLTLAFWWILQAYRQPTLGRWLRCGVLLGLVSLLRANVLLLGLALMVPLLVRRRRDALGLALGLTLVLLPVLLRNYAVGGDWVLTTSQGGANLYLGNHPGNTSGSYTAPSFVRPSPRFEREDFHRHAESAMGRPLLPSEGSSYYVDQVLRWARQDPAAFLHLQGIKTYAFVNAYEIPDNWSIEFVQYYSAVLSLPLPRYGWILPWAIVGAALALRPRRTPERCAFALGVGLYAASVIAFFIFSRYRYPITPAFQVLAAAALVQLLEFARAGRIRAAGLMLASGLGLTILAYAPPTIDAKDELSHRYFNLAASYYTDGHLDEAEKLCHQALSIAPTNHLALFTLSRIAGLKGQSEKEMELLVQAHRADPTDEDVLVQMAWTNARRGGYADAARFAEGWLRTQESYQLRRALVQIAQQNGQPQAARAELEQMARRYPGDEWVRQALAGGPGQAGNPTQGSLPQLGVNPVAAQVEALAGQKRYPEAIQLLQGEIAAGRASAATFQFLSNLYYLQGEPLRARDALVRALEMEPDNPLYKNNLRALDATLGKASP